MGNRTVPRYTRIRLSLENVDDLPNWEELDGEENVFIEDACFVDIEDDEFEVEERFSGMRSSILWALAGIFFFIVFVTNTVPDEASIPYSSYSSRSIDNVVQVASLSPLVENPPKVPNTLYPSLHWMDSFVAEEFATSEEGKEIRCLAQVLASESNDEYAMVKIAWVVRNRVEAKSEIFGEGYCGVAYRSRQFSGLNKKDKRYKLNISRDYNMIHTSVVEQENWENAIKKATAVYYADRDIAALPWDVFYFYSPVSMTGRGYANWARGCKAYELVRDLDVQKQKEFHFAFYRGSTCSTLRGYLEDVNVLPTP